MDRERLPEVAKNCGRGGGKRNNTEKRKDVKLVAKHFFGRERSKKNGGGELGKGMP